jgi:anti-anti-sigma regulatory factor
VRVSGPGTYAVGRDLKEFLLKALRSGAHRIRVDASQCLSMDSTFIGVLTLAAVQGREVRTSVEIARASERVQRQIAGLGIQSLFAFTGVGVEAESWDALGKSAAREGGKEEARQILVDAHLALGAANPENVARFHSVIESTRPSPLPGTRKT